MSSSRKHRRNGGGGIAPKTTSDGGHLFPEPTSAIFPSNFGDVLRFLIVITIAALVALVCNFLFVPRRHPVAPIPFCDTVQDVDSNIYDFDLCEPCPANGECSNGELIGCVFGYKRSGGTCVEDREFNRTAKKFADWVERSACEARAKFLCQGMGKSQFLELDVLKLMEELKMQEMPELDVSTLSMIKKEALRLLDRSLETKVGYDGVKEFMCPDQLVILYEPFLCLVKHWICEHALLASSILVLLAGGIALSWKVIEAKQLNSRAEKLYEMVCEILIENAMMSGISESTNVKVQSGVVFSWLRDHLLLPCERKHPVLWKKVEELIQQDSRIDQYPKLMKGESRIVLEWQVEGAISAKMRKGRREAEGHKKLCNAFSDPLGDQDREGVELLPG